MLLEGSLDILSSNTTFASAGNLTIVSTSDGASGNGAISQLATGASVTGNVTVQRYLSGEGRIWRYLSSPVQDASVAEWQDDFPITGTFNDPSTGTGIVSNSPSLYYFDESLGGTFDDRYVAYPTSGNAVDNLLVPGRGYTAFIREDVNPTTVTVDGLVNQGTVNYNVTYMSTGDASDGYNLVGNPYPSSIDWDDPGWTKTAIDGTIAIRDNPTGVFQYWNGSVGGITNGQIAMGQAFWVRTSSGSAVLTSTEEVKTSSGTNAVLFDIEDPLPNQIIIVLSDGTKEDKTYTSVFDGATNGFDSQFDALKLDNDIFDLSTYDSEGSRLAINFFPSFN